MKKMFTVLLIAIGFGVIGYSCLGKDAEMKNGPEVVMAEEGDVKSIKLVRDGQSEEIVRLVYVDEKTFKTEIVNIRKFMDSLSDESRKSIEADLKVSYRVNQSFANGRINGFQSGLDAALLSLEQIFDAHNTLAPKMVTSRYIKMVKWLANELYADSLKATKK